HPALPSVEARPASFRPTQRRLLVAHCLEAALNWLGDIAGTVPRALQRLPPGQIRPLPHGSSARIAVATGQPAVVPGADRVFGGTSSTPCRDQKAAYRGSRLEHQFGTDILRPA